MSAAVPIRRRDGDEPWEAIPADGVAEVQTLIGAADGSPIGCGFARFEDVRLEWSMSYDEVIHVLEGAIEIRWEGGGFAGKAGDVILVPEGTEVTYVVEGSCRLFFSTHPADWEAA